MILDAIVTAIGAVVEFLAGLFGPLSLPSWWGSVDEKITIVGNAAAPFGNWVPLGDALNAANFVFFCLGIGFAIRLIRIIASFLTAGGGSAG